MPLAFESHLSLHPLCICFHYTGIHGLDFWPTVLYFELLRFPFLFSLRDGWFLRSWFNSWENKGLGSLEPNLCVLFNRAHNRCKSSGIPSLFLLPLKRAVSIFIWAYICLPSNRFVLVCFRFFFGFVHRNAFVWNSVKWYTKVQLFWWGLYLFLICLLYFFLRTFFLALHEAKFLACVLIL